MPRKKYPYYPIYIDVEQHDVLIVGGGAVCARKAETMLRYGARITIVAPTITEEIAGWQREGKVDVILRTYDIDDLSGRSLVIASTDDACTNGRIARDCRRRKIPVNVVDVTHLCEFIVPAIYQQGSVQIAVSTAGKSPALARTIRETLEKVIGPEYSEVNDLLGSLRAGAKKALATDGDRKTFFDGIVAKDILTLLRDGQRDRVQQLIAEHCREAGVPVSEEVIRMA